MPADPSQPSTLTDADADRILRAWERANAEPSPVATCPDCGLTEVPLCDDGQLAAHGWARGGTLSDGPLDADGFPTPGEWSGCANRAAGPVLPPVSER